MQIILVIVSLYYRIIHTNPWNLYPGNNILIDFAKLRKINRLLFCFTFCRIILLPVRFFFCVFLEFLILFLSVIIFLSYFHKVHGCNSKNHNAKHQNNFFSNMSHILSSNKKRDCHLEFQVTISIITCYILRLLYSIFSVFGYGLL